MEAPGSYARAPRLYRLHAWLGAVPLAGFLVLHLLAQAPALWGPRAYASAGWRLPPLLSAALEVALIHVPLLVHAALGLRRATRRSAPGQARAPAVAGELVRRASAAVLLAFLLLHVWQFRVRGWLGVLSAADHYPELCASLSSTVWGGVPAMAAAYLLGVAAAAVHGASGLYSAGLGLGLVAGARERLWRGCCGALGVAVFVLGALIVIDLATGSVLIHLRGS